MIPSMLFSKFSVGVFSVMVLFAMTDDAPADEKSSSKNAQKKAPSHQTTSGYLGVHVTMLTPELRRFFGAAKEAGIIVSKVDNGSPAQRDGIKVGDVIEKADGKEVVSVWVLERIVTEKREKDILVVQVLRSKKPRVIKITMREKKRPVLNVGQIFQLQWPQGGQMNVELIDPRAFIHAAERFGAYFKEPMILARMQEMQRLIKRERTLELRIKTLEKRIIQLETQLVEH